MTEDLTLTAVPTGMAVHVVVRRARSEGEGADRRGANARVEAANMSGARGDCDVERARVTRHRHRWGAWVGTLCANVYGCFVGLCIVQWRWFGVKFAVRDKWECWRVYENSMGRGG